MNTLSPYRRSRDLSLATYRAALIGCGRIGSELADDPGAMTAGVCTHAEAYAQCPKTTLVAVCDANNEKARSCADRFGAPAAYTDPFRLLAEQTPEVVSICTPTGSHYEIARQAILTRGVKAVLAEKPLASGVAQARELVRLAQERGVVLAVNYSRRYAANHIRLKDFLAGGGIGTIHVMRGLYTKGTAHNGTHWFDLARFLVGEVAGVEAVDRLHEGGPDPTLDVRLHFECGAVGELLACRPAEFTVFEAELLGSRGRVRLLESGSVVERYRVVDGEPFAGYRGLQLAERTTDGLRDLPLHAVEDLVNCLETRDAPRCTGVDGVAALRIAEAAHTSAATKRRVTLERK
jgi:predicted dehydrogenase